jgi:hypothetical protein
MPAPTANQELLLEACLLPEDTGREAFQRWEKSNGLDSADAMSARLLPLLYHRLAAAGIEHPRLGILKGVYRRSWYSNQQLIHRAAEVLRRFGSIGLPTMLLGCLPVAIQYYRDAGARPMESARILVPEGRIGHAIEVLEETGFRRITWAPRKMTADFRRFRHALRFGDGNGAKIDLHWRVVWLWSGERENRQLWDTSLPLDVGGTATRSLDSTTELLLACTFGPAGIADAALIIGRGGVDWERLRRLAEETRLALPLRETLQYLAGRFQAPAPAEFLRELENARVSGGDRRLHLWLAEPERLGVISLASAFLNMNYRTIGGGSAVRAVAALPRFLQYYWQLDRPRDLPGRALLWMRQWLRRSKMAAANRSG